jgi:hypothetical protein
MAEPGTECRASHPTSISITTFSAWMTNAARRALLVRNDLRAVAEWEAEHGPLSDAELAAARRRVSHAVGDSAGPRRP